MNEVLALLSAYAKDLDRIVDFTYQDWIDNPEDPRNKAIEDPAEIAVTPQTLAIALKKPSIVRQFQRVIATSFPILVNNYRDNNFTTYQESMFELKIDPSIYATEMGSKTVDIKTGNMQISAAKDTTDPKALLGRKFYGMVHSHPQMVGPVIPSGYEYRKGGFPTGDLFSLGMIRLFRQVTVDRPVSFILQWDAPTVSVQMLGLREGVDLSEMDKKTHMEHLKKTDAALQLAYTQDQVMEVLTNGGYLTSFTRVGLCQFLGEYPAFSDDQVEQVGYQLTKDI